LIKDL